MKKKTNYKLKALRVEHRYKQIDLARKIGMSASTYVKKENGYCEFTASEMQKICSIFNKTAEEIFFTDKVTDCMTETV
ncbi:DNA-binding transcriptional regulator, XRE-family HTH domain [Alkalithermobacter thermoalcaliphilus JW-YL-7 = DSM 7308]|uniref:DNA-binding transcriptional regulator, XRE-family HTH domain n=1 Tax=Alkalithermobacter thermoalcaliphilus JW-YL-7 = DSM 7308 TaxID=1121328 RepID=A0A150FR26_CLOPD|nr:transcriptional regulator, XRE family [[Clostridium] paradoxum JW-YL-7 = DSM 7308]SHL12457.1 DNA-binding transcriptional regulator, XRE-family HTH domain [[Clostridium] paradoxum JW-YL-7 = DSM 7308]